MSRIFSTLIDYMQDEDWRYEIIEGETVLRFQVKTKSGRLHCYAEVIEEKDWLLFYSYMPVSVPEEKLHEASEFLTRANRGMRIGNFELDFDDGEVRYKTSIDVEGGELTPKMIDNLLHANLSTMDRYFSGLMKLIYSEEPPEDLIEEIERPVLDFEDFEEMEEEFEALGLGDEDLDDDFEGGPGVYRDDDEDEDDFGGRYN